MRGFPRNVNTSARPRLKLVSDVESSKNTWPEWKLKESKLWFWADNWMGWRDWNCAE